MGEELKSRRWIVYVLKMNGNGHCLTGLTYALEESRQIGHSQTTERCNVEKEIIKLEQKTWKDARHMIEDKE